MEIGNRKPDYKIELRLDGQLIGDCRRIATDLKWTRRRLMTGIDEISFVVNDFLFAEWLEERSTTIQEILRPYALDVRIIRNGVPVIGGYLATLPAYDPNGATADLTLSFDGYTNFLAGVYLAPNAYVAPANEMFKNWINEADNRARSYGKPFFFNEGQIDAMATITESFDNYKSIKELLSDRCDNITGAGKFDLYFHPDRTFDLMRDENFGVMHDYVIKYPTQLNGVSATKIKASEVQGFASVVIGIGSGETASNPQSQTAIVARSWNNDAVEKFGYCEKVLQDSSISIFETLQNKCDSDLALSSNIHWDPEIELSGSQIAPAPSGEPCIWIGDIITIQNDEDMTGQTSGKFRVMSLDVSVSSTNAEQIKPKLERLANGNE